LVCKFSEGRYDLCYRQPAKVFADYYKWIDVEALVVLGRWSLDNSFTARNFEGWVQSELALVKLIYERLKGR